MPAATDEAAVRALLDQFIEGWNEASGATLARPFARDAEFINIMGLQVRGRDLIARGHDELFETVFFGTRLSGGVENVRFPRPDVAYADGILNLQNSAPPGRSPRALSGRPQEGLTPTSPTPIDAF